RRVARRHHQPADRRPAREDRQQVRSRDLRGEARSSDQRLLLPARRGPAGVRGSARGDPRAGEAALRGAPRDQHRSARLRADRGVTPTTGDSTDTAGTTAGPRRPRVVLGVSGGIAAYKACLLLRLLTESGHDVTVVPTAAALEFVGAPTWAALSGKPIRTQVWDDVHEVPHVRLGQTADLVL